MSPSSPQTAATGPASTLVAEPPISNALLLSQVGSALGGILLFILLIAWLVRKLGLAPKHKRGRLINVVSSCQVGQRERIVIVEVDDTWLVLGVTPQQITTLHKLPAQPVPESAGATEKKTADFQRLLTKVLKRPEKPT